MPNFHTDEQIMERLQEHYQEALTLFPEDRIVGIFLQGSQNYGLDYEGSDVDTKLIMVPELADIALNVKPVSTTHTRENNEHIDLKDVRLYMETFRKQNLNFLEILFTKYKIINPLYAAQWKRLKEKREEIARMNPVRAVKSMYGIAMEKYHAMEHRYPSKIEIIDKYGYDAKQLSHLVRVYDFLHRYTTGEENYADCLIPIDSQEILDIKLNKYDLAEARILATQYRDKIIEETDNYCVCQVEGENKKIRKLLEEVQTEIIKISIRKELE